jgi:hypothetical protein
VDRSVNDAGYVFLNGKQPPDVVLYINNKRIKNNCTNQTSKQRKKTEKKPKIKPAGEGKQRKCFF